MIHLNNAPIFLEFLANNLKKISKEAIANNFYIAGKCNCNQSDCATVMLKKRKNSAIDENTLVIDVKNAKGIIYFHWLDDEYVEVEAILYKYPFKYEINRLFPKNGRLSKRTPTKATMKKIKGNDKRNLKRYFNNKMSLYEEKMFYRSDYKSSSNIKLFARVG